MEPIQEEDVPAEEEQTTPKSAAKRRGRKAKKDDADEPEAFKLAEYTDRKEWLHHGVIRLDEHKVFGQV